MSLAGGAPVTSTVLVASAAARRDQPMSALTDTHCRRPGWGLCRNLKVAWDFP